MNVQAWTFCRHAMVSVTCVILLSIIVGCAEEGVKTYPVKGKLTYKGGAPLTSGNVMFESLSKPTVVASGELQPDGSFEMASDLGKPGTVVGEHRVMILPPLPEFGEKAKVSNKYASFETSGLKATVTESENIVNLEIDK